MSLDKGLQLKLYKLKNILKEMKSIVIAFSGGVDSTLLAKVSYEVLGENAVCVTLNEVIHSSIETEESKKLSQLIGIKQVILNVDLVSKIYMRNNPIDRCYYCKYDMFSNLIKLSIQLNKNWVVDGSNKDDEGDYRPGLRALKELNIRSPLKEAKLYKDEIRKLSKYYDLPTWNKPSFACLASRIPYGETITIGKLKSIEKCEIYLRKLGFNQFRVRHHGDIARIEVEPNERNKFFDCNILDNIGSRFIEYGFKYVTIDVVGYKMGNLNKDIKKNTTKDKL